MEPNGIQTIIRLLEAGGPLGVALGMSWFLWTMIEKKDRAMRELYQRVMELSEKQHIAMIQMETALTSLRDTLRDVF